MEWTMLFLNKLNMIWCLRRPQERVSNRESFSKVLAPMTKWNRKWTFQRMTVNCSMHVVMLLWKSTQFHPPDTKLSKITSCLTAQSIRFSKKNSKLQPLRSLLSLKKLSLVEWQIQIQFMAKNNITSATNTQLRERIKTSKREMGQLCNFSEMKKLCMKSCRRKEKSLVKPLLNLSFKLKLRLQL